MERIPRSGELYKHFKDKMYQVLTIAEHSETGEKLVIYQALYGDYKTYARPLEMFISEVDHDKYPEVTQKYRFECVEQRVSLNGKEVPREESTEEKEFLGDVVEPGFIEFLETDNWDEKFNILVSLRDKMTDKLVEDFAVVLDVVIPEGPINKRYEELKNCIKTRQKYENMNLR